MLISGAITPCRDKKGKQSVLGHLDSDFLEKYSGIKSPGGAIGPPQTHGLKQAATLSVAIFSLYFHKITTLII